MYSLPTISPSDVIFATREGIHILGDPMMVVLVQVCSRLRKKPVETTIENGKLKIFVNILTCLHHIAPCANTLSCLGRVSHLLNIE